LAFQPKKLAYSGSIGEVTLGSGDNALKVGGKTALNFHTFEGEFPNPPKVAMEMWDKDPSDEWSEIIKEPFKDVLGDPAAWAKKCVEYGAELLVVQCKSSDPNGDNKSGDDVATVVRKVADAVDVPIVVWGTANHDKDTEVMRAVAEKVSDKRLAISPVEEGDYKAIAAACLGYNHVVVGSSPIDVNLAKQMNILLGNLGVTAQNMLIDPTTGGLGYGLEYSYSIVERLTQAALLQEDDKLQLPIISNVGNEVWKSKEANQSEEEAPELGDASKRGVMMEVITAIDMLLAGADIVIVRHPESLKLLKSYIATMLG
jgi:acetyl-CoA decarbonylase/synthase complex subunit delta